MFEPNDLESLLLDDHFLGLARDEDDEDDDQPVHRRQLDHERSRRLLARWVADIEAGRAQLPPGWKLSRPRPGVVLWISPSGDRYVATLPGENLPASGRS
jgi:hypothetical protein